MHLSMIGIHEHVEVCDEIQQIGERRADESEDERVRVGVGGVTGTRHRMCE